MSNGKNDSIQRGYLNTWNQLNHGHRSFSNISDYANVYAMECLFCGKQYATVSEKIDLSKCPDCQNGNEEIELNLHLRLVKN